VGSSVGSAADRLADAVRRLLASSVTVQADAETLRAATAAVEAATQALVQAPPLGPARVPEMALRHAFSIVTGTAHPVAPPVTVEQLDGEVRGRFRCGKQYEGGPGLVHGGILSLVLDHVLGEAAFAAGVGGMTVGLDVRYLAPTPIDADLEVACRVSQVDGRKVHLTGEVTHQGTATVTAKALFIQIDQATAAQLFPHLATS
jgi:acyl-coenzyme A thioesterase PaaI-like protein